MNQKTSKILRKVANSSAARQGRKPSKALYRAIKKQYNSTPRNKRFITKSALTAEEAQYE